MSLSVAAPPATFTSSSGIQYKHSIGSTKNAPLSSQTSSQTLQPSQTSQGSVGKTRRFQSRVSVNKPGFGQLQGFTPGMKVQDLKVPGVLLGANAVASKLVNPNMTLAKPSAEAMAKTAETEKITRREREHLMSLTRSEEDKLPVFQVAGVEFSLMDPEELRRIAVVNVTEPDSEMHGIGALNTINDSRMGVVTDDQICSTCHKDEQECPGHLGIIRLNVPVLHPLMIRYIIAVLMSVCNSCGGLLLTKDEMESRGLFNYTGVERLIRIKKAIPKDVNCRRKHTGVGDKNIRRCGPNPVYMNKKIKETGRILYKNSAGAEKERTVATVQKIFDGIEQEDATLLGFGSNAHPSRMIMQALPVIPPCSRPTTIMDGIVADNQLTLIYREIVSINKKLQIKPKPSEQLEFQKNVEALNFKISHFIDNTDGKNARGKKPFIDLRSQIQGKEGVIKQFIHGKRVNFAGRTVASPDPTLEFGQIRIPSLLAKTLTMKIEITPDNIESLQNLLLSGKVTHIRPCSGNLKGSIVSVEANRVKEYIISVGDHIERWLQNGDFIIFNRQPTLHKQSMLGAEVVLGEGKTIGAHLSYSSPLNLDQRRFRRELRCFS